MWRGKGSPQVPDSRSFGASLASASGFLVMPCDDTETQKHRGQGEKSRLVTLSPRNTPSSAWSFVSEPGSMVPTARCGRDASACHSLPDTAGRPVTWRAPLRVLWGLKGAEHAAVSPMGRQGCQGWEAAVTKRCARGLNPQPCCLRRGTRSPNSDRAGPGDMQPARALHLGTPPPPNGGRSRAGSRVRRAGSTVQAPHTCTDERPSSQHGHQGRGRPEAAGSVPLLPST